LSVTAGSTSSSHEMITRSAASPASSLIPSGPHACARPCASQRWTWRMVTSGRTALICTSPSTSRTFGFVRRMSLPRSVRAGRKGTFQAAAQSAIEIEKFVWSWISIDRDSLLGRAPVAVAKPLRDIAHPRGGDPANAAGADELVEKRVRDRSDELEVLAALPYQLMAGGERDQRLERGAKGDGRAVRDEAIDGLGHRHDLAQPVFVHKCRLSALDIRILCAKALAAHLTRESM